jgi:integrase
MASLHKDRRTGLYQVEFLDKARRPARKRVSTAVRDHRPADRLRRFWEDQYAEGRYDPWFDEPPVPGEDGGERARRRRVSPVSLSEARTAFLASRAHRAANTRANYDRVTEWFVGHVGGGSATATVTAADIEGWLGTLSVKPVTKANYVRHLRPFFRYCKEQGYTSGDVTADVRLERVPRQFPKALRHEEVEAVATYAEANCRDGAERSSAWCAPFIRLGAETGMRRNELLHLTWDRIDLEAGHLVVACTDAFTTKSGAERKIPLSERAKTVLARLQTERPSVTGRVFESGGRPIDPHTCSDTIKRFAVKAGVPRLTPHVLRHTAITRLIERGVPVPLVQRYAGHADLATTMRYCSIADDVYADRIVDALG